MITRNSIHPEVVPGPREGFTLLEVMIAVGLFSIVVAGSLEVYVMCQKFWYATSLNMQTSQMADMALSRMIFGVGTNSGIREATYVAIKGCTVTTGYHAVNSTAYAHTHYTSPKYWLSSTSSPPSVANPGLNFICSGSANDGGSWRLTFSNQYSGVQYIDYNFPFQTLSLGTTAAQRMILATYVNKALVMPDTQGVSIAITVARQVGNFVSTSTASTYLRLRNIPQ